MTRHTFQISETLLAMAKELAREQGLNSDDLIQGAIAREIGARIGGQRRRDRRRGTMVA